MPQEFQVLQCFKCSTFQVHQVKKSNKWNCKLCGEKQSVKKVFGRGSGSDCRCHVQKLNSLRGEIDAEQDNRDIQNSSRTENEEDVYSQYDSHRAGDSYCVEVRGPSQKWSKYLDGNAEEEEDETDDDSYTTSWQRFNMFNKPNRKRKRGNSNDIARARKYSSQRAEEPSSIRSEETYSRYDNSRPNSCLTGPSIDICDNGINRTRNQDEPSVFDVNNVSRFGQDPVIEDIITSDMSGNENIPTAKNDQGLDDLHMKKKYVGNRIQTLSNSSGGKLSLSSTRKQRSVSGASKWDKFTEKTEDSTDDDNDDTRLDFISGTEATALLTKDSSYMYDAVQDNSNNCSPKIAPESSFLVQNYSGMNSQIKGYSRAFISGEQSSADDILLSNKNVQNTKENLNPKLSRPSPILCRPSPTLSRSSSTLSRPSPTLSRPCPTLSRPSPTLCRTSPSRPSLTLCRPNFSVGDVEDTDLDLEI